MLVTVVYRTIMLSPICTIHLKTFHLYVAGSAVVVHMSVDGSLHMEVWGGPRQCGNTLPHCHWRSPGNWFSGTGVPLTVPCGWPRCRLRGVDILKKALGWIHRVVYNNKIVLTREWVRWTAVALFGHGGVVESGASV